MKTWLGHVAMALLGAVLLGTAGLGLGSWYGGRGAVPLSSEQAQHLAVGLLPGAEPTSSVFGHSYRYGVFLVADDFGARYSEVQYAHRADCALTEQFERNAAALGLAGLRRVPGESSCDGWRAERDGLTITFTARANASTLRIAPAAPDGFLASTLTGTLLGAVAGAALFWLVMRRPPAVSRLVGMFMTIALFPGAALTWMDLFPDGLAEPVWPIWQSLAPVLVPLWLLLLLVGLVVHLQRGRRKPTGAVATETRAAEA